MLARTWLEIEHRLDILRATDGAHVEVYLSIYVNLKHFPLL